MANRCSYVVVVLLLSAGPALSLQLSRPVLPTRLRGVSESQTVVFHVFGGRVRLLTAGLQQVADAGHVAGSGLAPARTDQQPQLTLKGTSGRHRRSLRTVPSGLGPYLATASTYVVRDLAKLGISAPASPAPQPTIKQVVGNGTGNGTRRLLPHK